jgi:hypothetical protein
MWLKAIANPGDRRGGFAMALRPTRETAQATRVPAVVPSSTRLDCSLDLGAAPEGAYLWKTGRQPGLSHV